MSLELSILHKFAYRTYHLGLRVALKIYPIPRPRCFNANGINTWLDALDEKRIQKVLIVTDQGISKLGLHCTIINALKSHGISTIVFDQIKPDPDVDDIEAGYRVYHQNKCQAIVAIGGGSVMDGGKLIGIRVAKPEKSLVQMQGLFRVMRRLPLLTAIPTTAGTGSETTVAAVVSDKKNQHKFAIADYCLVPKYTLLLPKLTQGLPLHLTATTAMDALTHAIEAYIGINGTRFTNRQALKACKLIFGNLPKIHLNQTDLDARENLLKASFFAGEAFTRTSVGYVHAIAHQLGAKYHIAHGLANAVLLDIVLEEYGDIVTTKLAEIADYCGFDTINNKNNKNNEEKAEFLLNHIRALKKRFEIPASISEIKESDLQDLAIKASN